MTWPALARPISDYIFFSTATATAGSCQDHLTPEKTQIFQTAVSHVSALFDNPHLNTNNKRSATTKKRKGQSQPDRTCARCGESKPLDSFSNNQRRKGASARCKNCVWIKFSHYLLCRSQQDVQRKYTSGLSRMKYRQTSAPSSNCHTMVHPFGTGVDELHQNGGKWRSFLYSWKPPVGKG